MNITWRSFHDFKTFFRISHKKDIPSTRGSSKQSREKKRGVSSSDQPSLAGSVGGATTASNAISTFLWGGKDNKEDNSIIKEDRSIIEQYLEEGDDDDGLSFGDRHDAFEDHEVGKVEVEINADDDNVEVPLTTDSYSIMMVSSPFSVV